MLIFLQKNNVGSDTVVVSPQHLLQSELFNQGEWPETPTGVLTHTFHEQIIKWAKQEEFNGPEINKHNPDKRCWSPEKKYELVCQVLFGESIRSVSIRAGINTGQLYQWVHKYKTLGYNGLINKPKGRSPKDCKMKYIMVLKKNMYHLMLLQ